MVHLYDNSGSPFPFGVSLRFSQRDGERLLYLRLPVRPPSRVVAPHPANLDWPLPLFVPYARNVAPPCQVA